jgi:hypothetical protein
MTDADDLDGFEREPLSEQELAIAAVVGRYVERRERGEAPCAQDLLAVAGEFGEVAVAKLPTVLRCVRSVAGERGRCRLTRRRPTPLRRNGGRCRLRVLMDVCG